MAEISYYWSDNTFGDGVESPYRDGEFSTIWRKLLIRDRTLQGYIEDYANELEVTWTGGDAISINTGAALVDGKFYENDTAIPLSIISPVSATRYDRVVLRKTWATQTVRVAIVEGTEGAGVSPITQEDGVIWEIPLATIRITTAGVITITDDRNIARSPLAPNVSGNFEEIDTVVGDGADSTITFDNIPQTYSHLMIVGQGRSGAAAAEANVLLRFNSDTGANYEYQLMLGENATASASALLAQTGIQIGQVPANTATANHAGTCEVLIPNYIGTDFYKQSLARMLHMPTNVLADFSFRASGGQWNNLSAITRIDLATVLNWAVGSTFTLYGMN